MADNSEELTIEYEQYLNETDCEYNNIELFTSLKKIKILSKTSKSSVYLVKDENSGIEFVLKETTKEFSNDLKILLNLRHTGIPAILGFYEDNETYYILQEYVVGETLEEKLTNQKYLPEDQVVDISIQLCEILKYLHDKKPYPIIHRDLKPLNILCTSDNTVKLIDFGTSREFNPSESKDTQYFGTLGYAAPEQFGFSQTDPRTDIFSLGVLMYRLLTGENISRGEYSLSVRKINVSVSKQMEKIIKKCSMFNPDQRYNKIDEVLVQLKKIKNKKAIMPLPVPALAGAIICILVSAAILLAAKGNSGYTDSSNNVPSVAAAITQSSFESTKKEAVVASVVTSAAVQSLDDKVGKEKAISPSKETAIKETVITPSSVQRASEKANEQGLIVNSLQCSGISDSEYEFTLNYQGNSDGAYRIVIFNPPDGDVFSTIDRPISKAGDFKFKINKDQLSKITALTVNITIDGKDNYYTFTVNYENIRKGVNLKFGYDSTTADDVYNYNKEYTNCNMTAAAKDNGYEFAVDYEVKSDKDFVFQVFDPPSGKLFLYNENNLPKKGKYSFPLTKSTIEKIKVITVKIIIDGKSNFFTFPLEKIINPPH